MRIPVTEDEVLDEKMSVPLAHTRAIIGAGRYEDALAVISRELDAFPDWAEPWFLMAHTFSRMSRFAEAVTACDEALLRDPWHIGAQELKAGLLLQLGYNDNALQAAQRLVALQHERAESHLFLAFAYAFCGHEIEAIEEARECKRIAPQRGIYHQALCVIHLTAKRWDRAERHALAALKAEGPIASVYHDLGVALDEQGNYASAQVAFAMAARLDARFTHSLRRFNRRRLVPTKALPALVATGAGIMLVPMGMYATVAFAATALVGMAAAAVTLFKHRSVPKEAVAAAYLPA